MEMKEILQLLKDDNDFFIGAATSAKMPLDLENPSTKDERKIRWHYNSIRLFTMFINKMDEYEVEINYFAKRRDEFEKNVHVLALEVKVIRAERTELYGQIE